MLLMGAEMLKLLASLSCICPETDLGVQDISDFVSTPMAPYSMSVLHVPLGHPIFLSEKTQGMIVWQL